MIYFVNMNQLYMKQITASFIYIYFLYIAANSTDTHALLIFAVTID